MSFRIAVLAKRNVMFSFKPFFVTKGVTHANFMVAVFQGEVGAIYIETRDISFALVIPYKFSKFCGCVPRKVKGKRAAF